MAEQGEKTEQPTQRRVQKARDDGRFTVSREFVSAMQFLAFVAILSAGADGWWYRLRQSTRFLLLQGFRGEFRASDAAGLFRSVVIPELTPLMLAGGLLLAISVFSSLVVTGMGFAPGRLAPDLTRLNPLSRLKQLPGQNFPLLVQAVLMLPVFGYCAYMVVRENLDSFIRLPLVGLQSSVARVASSYSELLWRAAGVFLVFGAIDLFRQQRRYRKELRMSKQDIRDESKEQEGNPHVKMRIRRLQRDLARRNMMKAIPTASAVIVNPTHYAVAVRYNMEAQQAPVVVAKGKNYLALRIRQRAIEHQIPIVENQPLAQALYKSVDVGQEIPVDLYRAVAEILAYIYKLMNGKLPGQ
ncbi:MAG: EscU/YscU/HrcU family type III secretion system export apparatus switch protein [Bryobacteraceae bacterium]